MNAVLVILSKFPDVFAPLLESLRKAHPLPEIIIVTSTDDPIYRSCRCVPGIEPFCFAKNLNLGIKEAGTKDVITLNDDTVVDDPQFFAKLADWADTATDVGIIAPLVDGGVGNPYQSVHRARELWPKDAAGLIIPGFTPICFVAAYLRRKMLEDIGPLDESFSGYGFEDNDVCIRARKKGWKTIIVRDCVIRHGTGGSVPTRGGNYSLTFSRQGATELNQERFHEKYSRDLGASGRKFLTSD